MSAIPTYVYLFAFAVVAVVSGRVLGGSAREEPSSLPRILLWALAAACALLGACLAWLDHAA
ncbi:MAG TPA: hypothetical protein VHA82_02330 [Ramlibacter sp.]|uniref:hypothetical protein n=1 Tax=Ramlibacter sp. TaxID=1917967 RepID=UPI002CB3E2D1|nr:hypothetical protein [Ramlibacter sp.]HVZ42619.1 hypothetical protein [Ramlibacter sp.]